MKEKNEKRCEIRLTQSDINLIKRNMKKFKITNMSFYIRTIACYPSIINVDVEPLKQTNYEINKIGTNINQIVRLANQNKNVKKSDIDELKNELKKIESLKVVTTFLGDKCINGLHQI